MLKPTIFVVFSILFLTEIYGLPTLSEIEQTIYGWMSTSAAPKSDIGTTFKLFTRNRRDTALSYTTNDIAIDIPADAGFQSSKRSIFIVHGFIYQFALPWLERMKDALLDVEDCNVFIVDWVKGDGMGLDYPKAAANARVVGEEIAQFISMLKYSVGVQAENVYIIGHSLGAHIGGFAGAKTKNLGRITGLDPAGPGFRGVGTSEKLDPSDALLVDVIHTDASSFLLGDDFNWWDAFKLFYSVANPTVALLSSLTADQSMYYGTIEKLGDLDFYPNGGMKQPGCPTTVGSAVWDFLKNPKLASKEFTEFMCPHYRAVELMIASIKGKSCRMQGIVCSSWDNYTSNKCGTCANKECFEMGYYADLKKPSKKHRDVYLRTSGSEPYCVQ